MFIILPYITEVSYFRCLIILKLDTDLFSESE